MSELNPPSQNIPGAEPLRARTAILRAALASPTSMKMGDCPDSAESVIDHFSGSSLFE
jgi:hypothetical protein